MKCVFAFALLVLDAARMLEGQNQVPPGLRKPPFVIVPPVGETAASKRQAPTSNRRDVGDGFSDLMVPDQISNKSPVIVVPEPQPPVRGPEPPVRGPEPSVRGPEPPVRGPELPVRGPEPPVRGAELPLVGPGNFIPHPDGGRPFNQNPPPPPVIDQRPSSIPQIDDRCYHCLCKAASDCDVSLRCLSLGANAYYCGQYHISWAYWADSGKPDEDVNNPNAWEECLVNKNCAERSIQGYMNKFAPNKDCNNDGHVDCIDYARIHKAGPPACNATWIDGTEYWRRFVACWGGAAPSLGGGRIDLRSQG